ncbi:hypothetical protein BT93_G1310 [Corymbia citriodora subsp. variegata]|nr:hypothetical protein BT93_G1310 [Corymbia citriodora subsp. variegata]
MICMKQNALHLRPVDLDSDKTEYHLGALTKLFGQ